MPEINYPVIVLVYVLIMSVIGFISMGVDKKRAIQHKWRIRERTLFIIALLGGAAGSVLGMQVFRHKTLHASFRFFMPLILSLQIGGLLFLFAADSFHSLLG